MPTIENLDVNLSGIGEVLKNRRVAVPPYQRLYAWTNHEVGDLFRDLNDAIRRQETEYFLGTIVITKADNGQHSIIDGQQRLTTASILLAAIRNSFLQRGDNKRANKIQEEYISDEVLETLENNPHIKLNDRDHDYYMKAIVAMPNEKDVIAEPETQSQKLLQNAFQRSESFVNSLVKNSQEPNEVLFEWINFLKNRAKVIVVEVGNESSAFTIFEVLNDRGLDLSVADLLKNYLFKQSGDRVSEAQSAWIAAASTLEALGERDAIKSFIRHVWSSKYGLTREKDLYEAIRRQISGKQVAIDFLKDLRSKARIYAAFRNPGDELWAEYGTSARQAIETLDTLRATQIRPLILAVVANFPPAEVKASLPMFVSWTVRFMIVGSSGSGTLESNYSERAKEVTAGEIKTAKQLSNTMKKVLPTDDAFEGAFERATVSTQYLARYYLGVIEAYKRGNQTEIIVNPNEEQVNLEHIMPQSVSEGWEHVSEEDRLSYRRRLGNLTLLDKKLNEKAGNVDFKEKKKVYAQSDIILTQELKIYDKWGPSEIDDRQKELAALAREVWKIEP